VLNSDGTVSNRSMVYTEYFVRGTEPADTCPYHRVIFPGIMATSGSLPEPVAPPPSAPGAPPAVTGGTVPAPGSVAATNPAETAATAEAPTQRRRGFWSRIFGRGNNDDDRKKEEERRRQEEERRRQQR
jgi:hypothetical protein